VAGSGDGEESQGIPVALGVRVRLEQDSPGFLATDGHRGAPWSDIVSPLIYTICSYARMFVYICTRIWDVLLLMGIGGLRGRILSVRLYIQYTHMYECVCVLVYVHTYVRYLQLAVS